MYLYLLKQRYPLPDGAYDEAHGFVVVAADEAAARELVASSPSPEVGPGDEGRDTWRDADLSTCEQLGHPVLAFASDEKIVLRDFLHG